MKKKLALLLAALLLACCLPLPALAAERSAEPVHAMTHIPLDATQLQVLALMEAAIRSRQEVLDLSDCHIRLSPFLDVLNELQRRPEFFYFDSAFPDFHISFDDLFSDDISDAEVSSVELSYKEEYGEAEVAAFEQRVQRALGAVLPGMDELQKALVLHEWLTQNVAYDYEDYLAGRESPDSHNAYGAMVKGVAVCEGYAKAYEVLLGRCGIDATVVSSLGMDHGWNLVKLGDSWFHVDATWDDPAPDTLGRADHTFFLLSDAAMGSRVSGGGRTHYGWDGDIRCTDTAYDGACFWSGCRQPLVFTDAATLWTLRSEGQGPSMTLSLVERRWDTGEERAAATVRDYWKVWGENAYWNDFYSGLCLWDGWLFFNDARHIYGYDPAAGSLRTVLTLGDGDGYLYSLSAAEDGLRYLVSRAPDEAGSIRSFLPDPAASPESAPVPDPAPAPAPEPTPDPAPEPPPAPSPEPSPAPAPAREGKNPFTDVSESSYYYPAVLWAYETGVTTGTSAAAFSPAEPCTRAQVVTFLWRSAGKPEPSGSENPFADVKESDYFCKAVLWAVEKGVTNGTGERTFSPQQTCSYAHILTFLYRAVTGNLTGSGAWYDDAFRWAKDGGLLANTLVGRDAGRINADCPRCDVVTYLWRSAFT